MSSALDGKQWREWIRGRDAEDHAKDHVKALLKGRDDSRKEEKTKVAQKTSEASVKKKLGTSLLRSGRKPKAEEGDSKKGEGDSRLQRMKSRFAAAKTHFKTVSDRLKDSLGKRTKTAEAPRPDAGQIAKHRLKQQEADATRAKQTKAKAPVQPVVRRAR